MRPNIIFQFVEFKFSLQVHQARFYILQYKLTTDGLPLATILNCFAKHFHEQIKSIANKTRVNIDGVYNGKCKLVVQNRNLVQKNDEK